VRNFPIGIGERRGVGEDGAEFQAQALFLFRPVDLHKVGHHELTAGIRPIVAQLGGCDRCSIGSFDAVLDNLSVAQVDADDALDRLAARSRPLCDQIDPLGVLFVGVTQLEVVHVHRRHADDLHHPGRIERHLHLLQGGADVLVADRDRPLGIHLVPDPDALVVAADICDPGVGREHRGPNADP